MELFVLFVISQECELFYFQHFTIFILDILYQPLPDRKKLKYTWMYCFDSYLRQIKYILLTSLFIRNGFLLLQNGLAKSTPYTLTSACPYFDGQLSLLRSRIVIMIQLTLISDLHLNNFKSKTDWNEGWGIQKEVNWC